MSKNTIVVVGGGHVGVEAALAIANMGVSAVILAVSSALPVA